MKTNIELIQAVIKDGFLKEYSMWLALKQVRVNSLIRNGINLAQIAKQSGKSRNCLRKHIQFFKEMGWVRVEDNNLVFISTTKLKKLYGILPIQINRRGLYFYVKSDISIQNSTNQKEIETNLRFALLSDRKKKFDFVKKIVGDSIQPSGQGALKKLKAAKEYLKDHTITLSNVPKYYTTSISSIARQWGCSSSTASRIIKKLEKQKKIKVLRQKLTVVSRNLPQNIQAPKNCFFHKNFLFKHEPNQYIFYGVPK